MTAERTTEFRFRATADTAELGLFTRELRALEKRVKDADVSGKEWNRSLRDLGRTLIEDGRALQQTSTNLRAVSSGLKTLAQNATVGSKAFFSLSDAANRFNVAAQPGTIGKLNVQLAASKQRMTELNLAVRDQRLEFQRLGREVQATEQRLARLQGGRGGRLGGFGAGAGAIAAGGFFGGPEGFVGSLAGLAVGGPGAALAGATIGAGAGRFRQQLGGFADQAAQLSRYQIALRETAGSQREYEQALEAITRANERLNIPIVDGTRAFTKLSAAVIGAGGNIQDAELAFAAVNNAIKATGGSSRDVEGALLAVTQVFSKGKVSAEELRRQLGDRLPGAVNRFAESLGVSTKELDKLLREGQVGLGDFMKFLADLNTDFQGTAEKIAASSDDAGARLAAAWERSTLAIGDALRPLGAQLQEGLIDVLDTLTPKVETLLDQLNENPERLKNAVDDVTEALKLAGEAALRTTGLLSGVFNAGRAVRENAIGALQATPAGVLVQGIRGRNPVDTLNARRARAGSFLGEAAAGFGTFFGGASSPSRSGGRGVAPRTLEPSGLITNDTTGADGSSTGREAERAAQLQQRLANEQRRLAKEKAQNERRLALEVFRYQQELDEQRYQNLRRLEDLRAANAIGALPQGQRRVAGILNGLQQSLTGLGDTARQDRLRVAAAQQGLGAARQFQAGVEAAPVLPLGAGGGNDAASRLLDAANRNLGLFAGQTERCADAIRELFEEAGVAIGVTKEAWDGLGSGSRLASGFFGNDIGQRLGRDQLRPGDLVGFERTYGTWGPGVQTHVGMYAGGGMMFDHSSRSGLTKRPLDTFAGKFMYGVRPTALAGGAPAGGPAVTFQNDLMRAQANTASAQAGVDQALAIQGANADVRPALTNEQIISASQEITQTYHDQAQSLEDSLQTLQLRNRLTLEGASPQVIQQEEQLLELQRSSSRELELINSYLDELKAKRENATGQNLLDIEKQIVALESDVIPKLNDGLRESEATIRRIAEESERLEDPWAQLQISANQARDDLQTLVNPATQIQTQAQAIGNSFGSAFESMITGSRSAKEAVADMFRGIAGSFANMAAQIAAQSIRTAIEGGISGIPGGLGGGLGGVPFLSGGIAAAAPSVGSFVPSIFSGPSLIPGFADGGRPRVGEPRWVGERGPELEVPFQAGQIISNKDVQDAIVSMARGQKIMQRPRLRGRGDGMAVPFRGSTGALAVPFQRGGGDDTASSAGADAGDAIRFESVVINGQEFVTRGEAEQIGRRAANRGAALAQKQLRNNPSNRKAVGIS